MQELLHRGLVGLTLACVCLAGCSSGPSRVADPVATIGNPGESARRQLQSMNQLDATPEDPEYLRSLLRPITLPGYSLDVRKAAFERLWDYDREGLKNQLALTLPKQQDAAWRLWLCERIAELDWKEMTPTLIRAWAAPTVPWADRKAPRPERLAIERMYGADRLAAVLLRELVESDPVVQANLRMRCWELLMSIGQEGTLRTLVVEGEIGPRDPLLRDIRAVVTELGVLPRTREEILWARRIGSSANAAYRAQAVAALALLSPERREDLRIRDLNVIVAASKIDPSLLSESEDSLYERLEARLEPRNAGKHRANFEGYGPENFTEYLRPQRKNLDWADFASMHLALDAVDVPEVRRHLFDFAERDMLDRTTEFGGMISLDAVDRFELVEFPPRSRSGDLRYEGPPELFEALATGLYHVHLHCQKFDNGQYAGPHLGDFQMADASGANCLVFTFIDSKTLDVDWYRHGRIAVDLGLIERPGS
ncbi:MAG: hypothetical protein ACO38V_02740 [Phycisphaerales bacterium]|jgi:hypothetical protein